MIEIWDPARRSIDESKFLDLIKALNEPRQLLSEPKHLNVLGTISKNILSDEQFKNYPDISALGFWLRSSHLEKKWLNWYGHRPDNIYYQSRGSALHLPPLNVNTLFVYSWAVSLLCGNNNLVRLPNTISESTACLLKLITKTLQEFGLKSKNIFCTYDYGTDFDTVLSKDFDLRLIWGGDEKVRSISTIPIAPGGMTIGFADRKSIAIISSDAYKKANDTTRNNLVRNLFRDIYSLDQMACASPSLIIWVGQVDLNINNDLYNRLQQHIQDSKYFVETGVYINKFVHACENLLMQSADDFRYYSNELIVLSTIHPHVWISNDQGGGVIYECVVETYDEIVKYITSTTQTICYYGFTTLQLLNLAEIIIPYGGSRLVPIGQSLEFDFYWDGFDLLSNFTKNILIIKNNFNPEDMINN